MKSNKSKISCKQGFTLIELLVVVLIIGILAAVAVPQYQVAVKKAQFAKLRAMASSVAKSVHIYYLKNGDWPSSFTELDVEPSLVPVEKNCVSNSEMFCCIQYPQKDRNSGYISCGRTDYSFGFIDVYADSSGTAHSGHTCIEKTGVNFCKALFGVFRVPISSNSPLWTPEGWKTGYSSYSIN